MKQIILLTLLLMATLERVVFDLGPNVELVTLVMLLTSFYFGKREAFGLVLGVMLISDLFLGNTNIFIFTWSGFLLPAMVIPYLAMKLRKMNRVVVGTGVGVGANLFFYAWTNFGVWLLDSWGMYSKDLLGLIQCYVNGLPFLKLQLTSTLLFVPIGIGIFELAVWYNRAHVRLAKSNFISSFDF